MKVLTQKISRSHPCSFAYKLVCVDDKFSKPIFVYRSENTAYKFIKTALKEYEYCKNVMKKHFNKNLIMTEEEEQFHSSNTCWICEKLIDDDDEKVRNHCQISAKFKGAALPLAKKVSVIFHNLGGYDSHLFFNELKTFDVRIDVIPN